MKKEYSKPTATLYTIYLKYGVAGVPLNGSDTSDSDKSKSVMDNGRGGSNIWEDFDNDEK